MIHRSYEPIKHRRARAAGIFRTKKTGTNDRWYGGECPGVFGFVCATDSPARIARPALVVEVDRIFGIGCGQCGPDVFAGQGDQRVFVNAGGCRQLVSVSTPAPGLLRYVGTIDRQSVGDTGHDVACLHSAASGFSGGSWCRQVIWRRCVWLLNPRQNIVFELLGHVGLAS